MEDARQDDERFMILFEAACNLATEQRALYLRHVCKDSPELLETLEQQIARHEQMGDFLLDPILRRSDEQRPFRPGDVISGRFHILRELGEGGMGVIYEAIDEKLQQRRALKCAKAGFQRRLPPEARAAMRVTHDNVCRVFEIHTTETNQGAIDFLCMEYLEGESLYECLRRQGPFRCAEAKLIIRQLCAGLDAAHEQGLLHRDLKPNNIMLTHSPHGTRAVITDFGLARETAFDEGFSGSSGLAGTPDYIAPELWLGAKASVASDIYALGVIIYELVCGRRPFLAETPIDVRLDRLPEPPSKWVPGLNPAWVSTILRCLDPNPEKRFSKAEQIVTVLEPPAQLRRRGFALRVAAAAIALGFLLQAFLYFGIRNPDSARQLPQVRLAILPATTTPDVPSNEGLLHDLSDRLRRVPDRRLVTIPVSEVVQKKVSDPRTATSRLGATHVLQYKATREGSKLILKATVTDARTLIKIRELEGEYNAENMSAMTAALFGTVMAAFELKSGLPGDQVSPAAYPYYAQATFFNRRDNRSSDLAIPLFQKAIALDPKGALPYAGLIEAYLMKYRRTGDGQWLDSARQALRDAESRSPDSAVVHIEAGNFHRALGAYETAVARYLRAIQLEPSNADAWLFLARAYQSLPGHQIDAAHAYQKAVDLQPGYYAPEINFSNFYIHAGNYAEAEKRLKRAIALAPGLAQAYSNLCSVYDLMGRLGEAERSCRRALQLEESTAALNNLAVMFEHLQRDSEALDYYQRAISLAPKRYLYYQGAGDCYRRMRRGAEATKAYRQGHELAEDALADNPSDANARALSGYFSARLQNLRTSEREISQALRLPSEDMEILRIAVLAEEAMHHRDRVLILIRDAPLDFLNSLGREPDLADFRRDSRFQTMVAQRGTR